MHHLPISLKLYVTVWVAMFTALTFLASVSWKSWTKKDTIVGFICYFHFCPQTILLDLSSLSSQGNSIGFWTNNNNEASFSKIKNQSRTTSNLLSNFRLLSSLVWHDSRILQTSSGERDTANFFTTLLFHSPSSPLLPPLCSYGSTRVRGPCWLLHGSTNEILSKHFLFPEGRLGSTFTCAVKKWMLDPGPSLKLEFRFSSSTYKERK